ncbi:hypothetical protein INT45_007448 [Circinella minor]|uniref:Uncharacterized protein n=1 Tax=Circinella minor TaxID=1195481 RepID=A0A8H7VSR8_9FUNG|nr:hypothetical protein INT45_007448 [Circinella minor]
MFDDIEVNYSKDIKTATDDLSILCFGSNKNLAGIERGENTMGSYNLLSRTDVNGRHIDCRVIATTHPQLSYYIGDTMWMNITTKQYWKISIAPYDRGYSLSKNTDKDVVLLEWFVNINNTTGRYMTHYHQPQGGLLTQIRPLTLTEGCEDCIILPTSLEVYTPRIGPVNGDMSNSIIEGYDGKSYACPVFRECANNTGRYRAISFYYLGYNGEKYEPTFEWNHSIGRDDIYTDNPKAMLNFLFENDEHDVPKEFIIE